MDFYTVRDMRTTPKSLWDSLTADGEVVITNNGKPTTLMLDISMYAESCPTGKGDDRVQHHAGARSGERLYDR